MKFIKMFVLLTICSTTATQSMTQQVIKDLLPVSTTETATTVAACGTAALCAYQLLRCYQHKRASDKYKADNKSLIDFINTSHELGLHNSSETSKLTVTCGAAFLTLTCTNSEDFKFSTNTILKNYTYFELVKKAKTLGLPADTLKSFVQLLIRFKINVQIESIMKDPVFVNKSLKIAEHAKLVRMRTALLAMCTDHDIKHAA